MAFDPEAVRAFERSGWDRAGLLDASRAGTARMAAMINAQPAAALSAIGAAIDHATERFRDGEWIAVPNAAIVAHGVRD